MNDDELTRRLEETLRAKAAQVPDATNAFDPTAPLTELDAAPSRHPWRYAVIAAALVAVLIGVTAVLVGAFSDDHSDTAGPVASTTTIAPTTTVAPTTTTVPAATTTTRPTSTPTTLPPDDGAVWSEYPQLSPDGTIPVSAFNAYLDAHPSRATDARQLALTFTHNDPPPTEPPNALRVEEHALANGRHQVVVFVRQADDSTAETREELTFAPHGDGTWRLALASWSTRCQANRGHQDYSTAPCV